MNNDQNQNQNQTESVQVGQVSEQLQQQADTMINQGKADHVSDEVKDQLVQSQADSMHDAEHIEESDQDESLDSLADAIQSMEENVKAEPMPAISLPQALLGDSFRLSQPKIKVQLIIPLCGEDTSHLTPDDWNDTDGQGNAYSYKNTFATGNAEKRKPQGILYNTLRKAFELAEEFNSVPLYVLNNDLTASATCQIMANQIDQRLGLEIPEDMQTSFEEMFKSTSGFKPLLSAQELADEESIAIMLFTPAPIIQVNTSYLERYLSFIKKNFAEKYNTEVEVILLADPIECVFDETQRLIVEASVNDLGFEINTLETVVDKIETAELLDIDEDDIEYHVEAGDLDEDDLEEPELDEESVEEDPEDIVEEDDEDDDEETVGFTLPSTSDSFEMLLSDNNLTSMGLLVLGKKL